MVDTNTSTEILGYLRIDQPAKTIYFKYRPSSNEKLLYDFNVKVGDTISWASLNYDYTTAKSIDTVQIGDFNQKRFNIKNPYYTGDIIQGIGSSLGIPNYGTTYSLFTLSYKFLNFEIDGKKIWIH